ncbi:MAG: MXAN_2562 family outer membrane beta-barrel protein [Myxococcaceae bacterium]
MISIGTLAQTAITTTLPGILTDCNSADSAVLQPHSSNTQGTPFKALIVPNSTPPKSTDVCPSTNTAAQGASYTTDSAGKLNFPVKDLLSNYCGASKGQGNATLCVYAVGGTQALAAQVNYSYNTAPNNLPSPTLSEGNKQIIVTINDPSIGRVANYNPTYEVCYADSQHQALINSLVNTTNSCPTPTTGTSTTITLGNLDNGTTYYVIARVQGSSNQWTPALTGKPMNTDGFAEVYDGAQNPLSFGCSQTSGGPATWGLFLLLGLFLRRPRRFLDCLAVLAMTISIPAFADVGQMNFSTIGSTYKPNLDASTKSDGSTARQFYGPMFSDKLLPLIGVEVDWHLFDDFGSLQLGFGAAYAYAGGSALTVDANNQPTTTQSSDPAGLHMLHLRPQLTYLLDSWVDYFPLVPYIRGGIVAASYMFTYQGGLDKEDLNKNKPMGVVFGYEAAAGLMLALDWMEPSVSKAARANNVYDHIYLKSEVAYMPINNFHQNGLDFSPAWPKQDLPLMLTFGLVFEFK